MGSWALSRTSWEAGRGGEGTVGEAEMEAEMRHKRSPAVHIKSGTAKEKRREATGRTGQDRTTQDRAGQDSTGQDNTGQDRTGWDRPGRKG